VKVHPKSFDLSKNSVTEVSTFSNVNEIKLFVIKCMSKSLLRHIKQIQYT